MRTPTRQLLTQSQSTISLVILRLFARGRPTRQKFDFDASVWSGVIAEKPGPQCIPATPHLLRKVETRNNVQVDSSILKAGTLASTRARSFELLYHVGCGS